MSPVRCGKSEAQRRYGKAGLLLAVGLMCVCAGMALYEGKHTPTGLVLYALAGLPSLLIIGMIVNVGRYLREETDEFQRDQTIRSLLWGTGAILGVSTYMGFLRMFGWTGHGPFLMELGAFCWAVVIARGNYRRGNRVRDDD